MVRVISVHHFTKQEVTRCPVPTASTLTSSDSLIVCTQNQFLEVRDVKKGAEVSHSFQTVDKVVTVCHNKTGDYLGTLEGDYPNTFVRVYTNWRDKGIDNAPVRPRIASCVTPSVNNDEKFVDMIEIPQKDSPIQMSTCSSTGNLIVAAKDLVIVYKLSIRTNEHSRGHKSKYIDFEECLHIFHRFIPHEIRMCEDVIAVLSANEVHIFKVKFSEERSGDEDSTLSGGLNSDEKYFRSISVYSFTDSEASMDPEFRLSNGSESESSPPSSQKPKKNVTAQKQQDSEAPEDEVEGHSGNVRKHPLSISTIEEIPLCTALPEIEAANREYISMMNSPKIITQILGPTSPSVKRTTTIKYVGSDYHLEVECVTLVHCKLLESERDHETLKNLSLEPVFWKEFRVRKNLKNSNSQQQQRIGPCNSVFSSSAGSSPLIPNHPLQSSYHCHLMSISACFTSNNEGYLYHLPGHLRKKGKGCGVQKIGTYPFTSRVNQIAMETSLLHAITDTGLETYTLRSGAYTIKEAENLNNRTNDCPAIEDNPICLVGLRPFIGTRRLMVSNTSLVLMTNSGETTDDKAPWTLYSLRLPSTVNIYKDMMQLANLNKAISPQGYYQLLCEAHVMLRSTQRAVTWHQAFRKLPPADGTDVLDLGESYKETCWLLALFYLTNEQNKNCKNVLPFFRMSGLPIAKIVQFWKVDLKQDSKSLPGLLHLIKERILHPSAREKTGLDAKVSDEIIDILGNHSCADLANLIIQSPNFKDFKASKMLTFLSEPKEISRSAEELLAYIILGLDQGIGLDLLRREMKEALYNPIQFSDLLIMYPRFLIEGQAADEDLCFTEFAMLMQTCVPELFCEILVSLIFGKDYSLHSLLSLFMSSLASMSSIQANQDASQSAAILQLFLETYFIEVIEEESGELDEEEEQALVTLVRSYLTSLSVPVRFVDKDIDTDIFGQRLAFLDKLPPFQNSAKEVLDADSPDFWCQNSLLKLQSLMSSTKLALPSCKAAVLHYLEMYKDKPVEGDLSLKVLSLDLPDVIKIICQARPGVIILYSKEIKFNDIDWKLVLTCLQNYLASDHDEIMHEACYSTLQEVLDHLAQTMDLETFMNVLPEPENNEEFQGYIQMCRKNQQAGDIQALIVATGHKLLSTLTL